MEDFKPFEKLTKEELIHVLFVADVTPESIQADVLRMIKRQKTLNMPCHLCVSIAKKLKMEAM